MAKDPICGMEVVEKTALKIVYEGETYFFCSKHCQDKFAGEKNISLPNNTTCARSPGISFYKNKIFIVSTVLILLVIASYVFPLLISFRNSLTMYLKTIWWAVLLGLLLGGIIDYYVPREYISYLLARPGKQSIFNSVILGFFMSACSHGILALSIQLHKKGASNPAVVAFLLASPWANMPLTIMLIGFFGIKALFIIFSAIVIALVTGFIFQFLEKKNLIEHNHNTSFSPEDFSLKKDIKKRLKGYKFSLAVLINDVKGIYKGSVALANMVLWWILIGIGLASFAGAYIPSGIFQRYMGPTAIGLIITLVVATIIEVCSEGSAPMAFEIFKQTGALGNTFVFLMAGVATDYTEIGLLWHNVGKKTAIWLPIVTVPQVIALGILANILF
jgi:uncharacterized membrane protein YraQ (UPF0718 family)/YHS domain-containing protein